MFWKSLFVRMCIFNLSFYFKQDFTRTFLSLVLFLSVGLVPGETSSQHFSSPRSCSLVRFTGSDGLARRPRPNSSASRALLQRLTPGPRACLGLQPGLQHLQVGYLRYPCIDAVTQICVPSTWHNFTKDNLESEWLFRGTLP